MTFVAPSLQPSAFTCPHCGVLARQYKWGKDTSAGGAHWAERDVAEAPFQFSKCENCGGNCAWFKGTLFYPDRTNAPPPNRDMPTEVRADYEEAARVYAKSPRGAAALLRLAVQKLMSHLGQPGKNINDDIGALVKQGLPVRIQQALDVVRVTGNNAVHPGLIDANDTAVAEQLFSLVNLIIEYQISLPSRLQEMYDALPKGSQDAIKRRDA
jgi:hypothetical protein